MKRTIIESVKSLKAPNKRYDYAEFLQWTEQLVSEGKTSGKKQSESQIRFTSYS